MLERNGGIIRAVAWSEICPWLSIFRTFRLAIGFRVLVMGAAAILLTAIGWGLLGWMFSVTKTESVSTTSNTESASTTWLTPYAKCPWKAITDIIPDEPPMLATSRYMTISSSVDESLQPGDPVSYPFAFLIQPMREGFGSDVSLKSIICLILCGFWSLATWAFFGAAICRIASVQLATNERIGLGAVLRHACTKYMAYFFAPLIPLVFVALAVLPVMVLGFIMYSGGFGVFLAALAWPLMLIAGLIMALLLLGLFFGWPLMWGTISTEGTDSFDALSRSYAYVFQRPLHYLFFALVAAIFGGLGWILVRNFASGIVWLTYWAASWGATNDQIASIMQNKDLSGLTAAGAWLIHLWTGCVKLLAVGFMFSYFWTASVAIYFLLRRTVDATEMDEVFLDADEGEKTFALPKIMTDQTGAPVVAEGTATTTPDTKTN